MVRSSLSNAALLVSLCLALDEQHVARTIEARDCDDNIATLHGRSHTCAQRRIWFRDRDGKTLEQAMALIFDEFPDICSCYGADVQPTPKPNLTYTGPPDENIVVGTFNTLYDTCWGSRPDLTRQAREIAEVMKPDILGTQEDCDHGKVMLAELRKLLGYDKYKVADLRERFGNPIYYNSDRVQFIQNTGGTERVMSDQHSQRDYAWAKFRMKTSNRTFWLFNIHMPHEGYPYGKPADWYTVSDRWGYEYRNGRKVNRRGYQGEIARIMLNKLESFGGGPALFTGDFNSHKDNDNWEKYAVKHGVVLAGKSSQWSIDQIYYTENHWEKISTTTGNNAGSDHKSFRATVNLLGEFTRDPVPAGLRSSAPTLHPTPNPTPNPTASR